jgi:hypothetical protein
MVQDVVTEGVWIIEGGAVGGVQPTWAVEFQH